MLAPDNLQEFSVNELLVMQSDIRRVLKVKYQHYDITRPDWDTYFMNITQAVSLRGGCSRRKVGAVLVDKDYRTLSTGYNGKAAGLSNCLVEPCKGACMSGGKGLHDCEAIHAEVNALIRCPDTRQIHTAYVSCSPCVDCINILLGTGCKRIVFAENYANNEESQRRWLASGREWIEWTSKEI